MPDTEQMREEAVAARLGQHALARIDQDHRKIGGRRAGHHVARVLFVPRRLGDDELALLGREEAIGDVDRDPLLALGCKAVAAQLTVYLLPLRPSPPPVALEPHPLNPADHLSVLEPHPATPPLSLYTP